jgi:glutamate formiminotransferase/formiminotetrahydrofolate cyclodeaminase
MTPIVECVPNISEGRDRAKIDRIAGEIRKVPGVTLLDVDPNGDYHRCVITFAGKPDACVEAMFRLTAAALREIDMTVHKGGHPRMGAVDVAPFVPVSNITMAECAELAAKFGERAGRELGIPIYLYEAAARKPSRQNLANVRRGEYEGLEEKLRDPEWAPDFGPAKFVPKSGAIITGARFFLIAYNVNLETPNVEVAHDIALHVREMGWPMVDLHGEPVLTAKGGKVLHPGPLLSVKGMGVYLEEGNFTQVSMNLTNFRMTPPHTAYEQVKSEAAKRNIKTNGTEVVGLIPLEALLLAAEYYIWRDDLPRLKTEHEAVQLAHDKLGLSSFNPFVSEKKIIEYSIM